MPRPRFTEGRWYTNGDRQRGTGALLIYSEGMNPVAAVPDPDGEGQYNAALITAAPRMYRAIEEMLAANRNVQERVALISSPDFDQDGYDRALLRQQKAIVAFRQILREARGEEDSHGR